MNKKTTIRFRVFLVCEHELLFDISPRIADIVWCLRCEWESVVCGVRKTASPVQAIESQAS